MARSLSFKKFVYVNFLAELTHILRLHGLYPTPDPRLARLVPDWRLNISTQKRKRRDSCVKYDWVHLRSCIERDRSATFGTLMRRHRLSANAVVQKGRVPSLLELVPTLYTVQLSENRLRVTK